MSLSTDQVMLFPTWFELLLPGRGAGRELADFLLVPACPAHFGGVRALARGGDDPAVDVEEVAVGVEAELGLDPASALRRHVLVPDRRRLDDVAVAVEHGEVLAHGFHLSKKWSIVRNRDDACQ